MIEQHPISRTGYCTRAVSTSSLNNSMKRLLAITVLAGALSSAALSPSVAQAQSSTVQTSVGSTINGIGRSSDGSAFTTLAQTFVAPTGFLYLQQFSLYLTEGFGGADTRFHAYVYEFDGNIGALNLGQQLYRSSEFAGSGNFIDFDTYTFNTSGLLLDGAKQYAFVLSASEPFGSIPDFSTTFAGGTDADEYAGGELFGAYNEDNFLALGLAGTLTPVQGSPDLSFSATFSSNVVPEPGTMWLLVAGLGALVVVQRRRRA